MKNTPAPDWRTMANALALAAGELVLVGRLVAATGAAGDMRTQLETAVSKTREALDAWLKAERAARSGRITDAELDALNEWFKDNGPGAWSE